MPYDSSGHKGLPSFGGGILSGNNLLRTVYLDEAGTSCKKNEPFLVVAGIILDPDNMWNKVEGYIRTLASQNINKPLGLYGRPYIFHAKDIWHGSGDFPRDEWTLERRGALLKSLCEIPSLFNIPLVFGSTRRDEHYKFRDNGATPDTVIANLAYSEAFLKAAARVDEWMKTNAPNEVTMIIAEDIDKPKKAMMGRFHAAVTDRSQCRQAGAFQSEHIVEQISFMRKEQSAILQLADICAFVFKRKLQNCKHIEPYFELLKDNIWYTPGNNNHVMMTVPVEDLKRVEG